MKNQKLDKITSIKISSELEEDNTGRNEEGKTERNEEENTDRNEAPTTEDIDSENFKDIQIFLESTTDSYFRYNVKKIIEKEDH